MSMNYWQCLSTAICPYILLSRTCELPGLCTRHLRAQLMRYHAVLISHDMCASVAGAG